MIVSTIVNNCVVSVLGQSSSLLDCPSSATATPSFSRSSSLERQLSGTLAFPSNCPPTLISSKSAMSSHSWQITAEPLIQICPSTAHRFDQAASASNSNSSSPSLNASASPITALPTLASISPSMSVDVIIPVMSAAMKKKARKEANRAKRSDKCVAALSAIFELSKLIGEHSHSIDRATYNQQQQKKLEEQSARATAATGAANAAVEETKCDVELCSGEKISTPLPIIAEQSEVILGDSDSIPVAPWLDMSYALQNWHAKPLPPDSELMLLFDPYSYVPKSGQLFWAKGVGYGSGGSGWDVESYLAQQEKQQEDLTSAINCFCMMLRDTVPIASKEWFSAACTAMYESPLLFAMESYLRNDSVTDMVEHHYELYTALFQLCELLLSSSLLWCRQLMFAPIKPESSVSVVSLLMQLNEQVMKKEKLDGKGVTAVAAALKLASIAEANLKKKKNNKKGGKTTEAMPTPPSYQEQQQENNEEQDGRCNHVMNSIKSLNGIIKSMQILFDTADAEAQPHAVGTAQTENNTSTSTSTSEFSLNEIAKEYESRMKVLQFDEVSEFGEQHHYQSVLEHGYGATATNFRKLVKRLASEYSDLSSHALPLHVESSIVMRVHDTNMQQVQFLVFAPPDTPYGHGAFLFDAFFPPGYPNVPPLVNLQTTGRCTFRFNPNLYECGKVCLSILGTWSGGQGEGWTAGTSTFLQVVVSIQSLIFVPQPYFNEPSYEFSMHTKHAQAESHKYNRNVQQATIQYSMLDMLQHPPRGFEEAITTHFYYHQHAIRKQVRLWAKGDTNAAPNIAITDSLIQQLDDELSKLTLPPIRSSS